MGVTVGQGKYSPCKATKEVEAQGFGFNCYGDVPTPWNPDNGITYDSKTMFADYDCEGFDSYGYSAFNRDGEFVGHGSGVDRYGNTEMDYMPMSPEEFDDFRYTEPGNHFKRNR